MTDFGHIPVLLSEAVAFLSPKPNGLYADGTLGGGGHTAELVRRSDPTGRVLGIDRDQEALQAARARLSRSEEHTSELQSH